MFMGTYVLCIVNKKKTFNWDVQKSIEFESAMKILCFYSSVDRNKNANTHEKQKKKHGTPKTSKRARTNNNKKRYDLTTNIDIVFSYEKRAHSNVALNLPLILWNRFVEMSHFL